MHSKAWIKVFMTNLHKVIRYSSLVFIFISVLLVGFSVLHSSYPKIYLKAMQWQVKGTKLNYLQLMFQLGTATSIAFALAGPQIRHVLGPKIRITKNFIRRISIIYGSCAQGIGLLEDTLCSLENHQQDLGETQRGAMYIIHLSAILFNLLMLIWSSLIDPNGRVWNIGAVYLLIGCMGFPLIDLIMAYLGTNPIRQLLQQVRSACESRKPEEIERVRRKINEFIEASSVDRFST